MNGAGLDTTPNYGFDSANITSVKIGLDENGKPTANLDSQAVKQKYFETCSVLFDDNRKIAVIGGLRKASKSDKTPKTPYYSTPTVAIYDIKSNTKVSGPSMNNPRPRVIPDYYPGRTPGDIIITVEDMQENRIACGTMKTQTDGKYMIIVMSKTGGKMTYEGLDVTGGTVDGRTWQMIDMQYDDQSSDNDKYYAQFVNTTNPTIPLVTMTSTTEDNRYKTKMYKLKCQSLTECSMVGQPRCAEDGTCAEGTLMENAVYSDDKVWPYTAFKVEDDTFPSCKPCETVSPPAGLSSIFDRSGMECILPYFLGADRIYTCVPCEDIFNVEEPELQGCAGKNMCATEVGLDYNPTKLGFCNEGCPSKEP